MKTVHTFFKYAAVFLVLLSGCQQKAAFEIPAIAGSEWFKGNTHTHTTQSDGDSSPEAVATWYKEHGYQFLVLSDHNVLTDPKTLSHLVDSTFLLIPGEELSTSFDKCPVHVNGLNISRFIDVQKDSTLVLSFQKHVDDVREAGGVAHINHPNFRWGLNSETLARIENYKLLEIFNGHPTVHNYGGGGYPSVEAMWDELLSGGKRVYGVAVDDAHHFKKEFTSNRANPGRGWVVVRTDRLDGTNIAHSLENGSFYASTGVELDDIIVRENEIEIHIRQRGDFKYRTEFIGRGGKVLAESVDLQPIFHLEADVGYVRAKVYDSGGAVAWIQPVFLKK
ncbi:MAG: CehA/McbA family metallohydrolase [bacterium]